MLIKGPTQRNPQITTRSASRIPKPSRPFVQILVVEADIPVRVALEHVLARAQYRVVSAKTAEEAVRLLRQSSFDLLLTDVKLPGIDGIELARQAKAYNPRLPILVFSGMPDPGLETRALGAGATLFLRKPLGAQELSGTVAAILERRDRVL